MKLTHELDLMRLEIVEGFATALAAIQRLAGCGAEAADQPRMGGTALWTGNGRVCTPQDAAQVDRPLHGWGDAVASQRLPALLAHPVRGPGGRQHAFNVNLVQPPAPQDGADVLLDFAHGRTARVRGRDRDDAAGILET